MPNSAGASTYKTDNGLIFNLRRTDCLNPATFITEQAEIKNKIAKQMTFFMSIFDQGLVKSGSRSRTSRRGSVDSDVRSTRTNRALISNPLYGHKIKHLVSTDSNTVIVRIKNDAFMNFVHPDALDSWHERE